MVKFEVDFDDEKLVAAGLNPGEVREEFNSICGSVGLEKRNEITYSNMHNEEGFIAAMKVMLILMDKKENWLKCFKTFVYEDDEEREDLLMEFLFGKSSPRFRREIAFDLDTNALKTKYGATKYSEAYARLKKVFDGCGFEHRQDSVYCSIKPISFLELCKVIRTLKKECEFLKDCLKIMDVTRVGWLHGLTKIMSF